MNRYVERMTEVERYVRQHLREKLNLEQLAQVAKLSPFHFHRIFKALTGEKVHEFVTRMRLEQAGTKLKFSAEKISDIAFEVGYENPETFIRAFTRLYDCTPSEFRKEQKKLIEKKLDSIIKERILPKLISVEIKKMDSFNVAYLEHKGPYKTVGQAWEKLIKATSHLGQTQFIGIPYNDPHLTIDEKIRYDACIRLASTKDISKQISQKTIPGGLFAITTHYGSYEGLDETYHLLYGLWLPNQDYTLRDEPPLEYYVTDSRTTPPEEAITEIYLPIK